MAIARSTTRKSNRFASLSPVMKLALATAIVAVLAAVVQGVTWLAGMDFHVLHEGGGGRGVLLALALMTLFGLMAADRRSAADYGLAPGPGWRRLLFGGFALGVAICSGYCLVLVLTGAYRPHFGVLATSRSLRVLATFPLAFPVAMIQQIILSGYLLSVIRERHSRITAVLLPAALFAVFSRIQEPSALISPENLPRLVGLFLVGTLLGLMRLHTGSIFRPAGFLAGCIAMGRLLRKTGVLALSGGNEELSTWFGPGLDLVQSPVIWLMLLLGIGWFAVRLWKQKETRVIPAAIDTGFKRVFPFSNGLFLAPLDVWLGQLVDSRFRVGWAYLPRLAAILVSSTLNTVLTLPERLIAPLLMRRRRVADPVFLVGVHRSGTTHLHNLMTLDPQFASPRAYQVFNPGGFFTCSWLVAPLMAVFFPWKRPMDQVRFHIFAPQEEEFALAGVSRLSPYWGLSFPRRWAACDRYIFPGDWTPGERRAWQRHLLLFLRKLTFWSGKRPLLKNPHSTGRVGLLREMFPKARFVHLSRHPYDVYRSNMHIAREGHVVHQLQDPDESDSYQTRFLGNYRAMEDAFYRDIKGLPADQVAELAFEHLEQDPIGQLRRVYAELGLEFTAGFQSRLESYLEGLGDYQKNRFRSLPEEDRRRVDAEMGEFMARWGYRADDRNALSNRAAA